MKIAIKTLGCKANRYESDLIENFIKKIGGTIKNFNEKSDIYLVNTCTITHVADKKSRQMIRAAKKINPNGKIIVFGCGIRAPEHKYNELKEIDYTFNHPKQVIDFLKNELKNAKFQKKINEDIESRTRALIKIQDGCNNFCSYCIVPLTRGREESYKYKDIMNNVREKLAMGFKEIVITGIIAGNWNDNKMKLEDLLFEILKEPELERLRLSSLEPENFSNKFLGLFDNPKFCQHLHLCLQSGCDKILKMMRRRYDTKLFKKVCDKLRKKVPDIAITTDLIVGFPGETEADFKKSLEFCKKMKFSKIHVFKYSKRKGTQAAIMSDQIPYEIKVKRSREALKIGKEMRKKFYAKQIGKEVSVLFETKKNGYWQGYTGNYILVQAKSDKNLCNELCMTNLVKINKDSIIGRLTY